MSICEHPSEQITSVCSHNPCLSWRSGLFSSSPNDLHHHQISSSSTSRHPSLPHSHTPPASESVQAQISGGAPDAETNMADTASARQSCSASFASSSRHSSVDSDSTSLLRNIPVVMAIALSETSTPPASESTTGSGVGRRGSLEHDSRNGSVLEPTMSSSLSQALALLGEGGRLSLSRSNRSSLAEESPPAFLCPILQDVMSDPIVVATGQTYDRNSISRWLAAGHRTCPATGLHLTSTVLLPNYALRHAIQSWASKRGILLKDPERPPTFPPAGVGTHNLPPGVSSMGGRRQDSGWGLGREWAGSPPSRSSRSVRVVLDLFRGSTANKEDALKALCDLASTQGEPGRARLVLAGGIPPLVALVQEGEPSTRDLAARCLRYLCRSSDPFVIHAASTAIPFLVNLLSEGTPSAREAAAGALVNLSAKADINKLTIVAACGIPPLVAMLDGHNPHATAIGQEVASAALCNLAADENNRDDIAEAGAIPHFVHLVLHGAAPGAGEYSAHALGSLACHNPVNAFSIIQAGAVLALLRMIGLSTPWGEEAGTRALSNLSAAAPHFLLEALEENGGLADLTRLVSSATSRRAGEAAEKTLYNLHTFQNRSQSSSFDASENSETSELEQAPSPAHLARSMGSTVPRYITAHNIGEYSAGQTPVQVAAPLPLLPRVAYTASEEGHERTSSYPPFIARIGGQRETSWSGNGNVCLRTALGSGWAPPRAPTPARQQREVEGLGRMGR